MQFVLQRIQQNSGRYTHILGMRCSRQHCKACNCLFKLYLGADDHEFTAAMRIAETTSTTQHHKCRAWSCVYTHNSALRSGRSKKELLAVGGIVKNITCQRSYKNTPRTKQA